MYIENPHLKKYLSRWLLSMCVIISVMIIVGGLTRLTDSGLSITEWQLFSGIIPPLNETQWIYYFELYKKIPEYKLQNFDMSISDFKVIFWWEYFHRILGRIIGIVFLLPLIFFSIKLGFFKTINFHLIFILICLQGFIGWYMVSSGLVNRVDVSHYRLALHLLIAFIILSLILWNYLKLKNINLSHKKIKFYLPIVFLILIFCQITVGAFVSGMDAGTIYNSWPLMGSSYFPDDNNIINLFKLSAFNDPSLVQFMHRNLAYVILIFFLFLLIKIYRGKLKNLYLAINFVGIFLFIQILLGIFTLIHGAQIFLASMHQLSSIFLVSSSVYLLYLNSNQQPSS